MNFKEGDIVHSDLFGKGIIVEISSNTRKVYRIHVAFVETSAFFTIKGEYFNGMESLADIVLIPPTPTDTEVKYH